LKVKLADAPETIVCVVEPVAAMVKSTGSLCEPFTESDVADEVLTLKFASPK
jgi:hypothetical protein